MAVRVPYDGSGVTVTASGEGVKISLRETKTRQGLLSLILILAYAIWAIEY